MTGHNYIQLTSSELSLLFGSYVSGTLEAHATSREPVLSDRRLMAHTAAWHKAGIGFYGVSIRGSLRKYLAAAYRRLLIEVGEFSVDGTNSMMANGWLEKPPSAPNRQEWVKD